jgi:hypothetical protein
MLGVKKFGKLGNRGMARLATAIDGGMVLPERNAKCRVACEPHHGYQAAFARHPSFSFQPVELSAIYRIAAGQFPL